MGLKNNPRHTSRPQLLSADDGEEYAAICTGGSPSPLKGLRGIIINISILGTMGSAAIQICPPP